jgi:NADH-quinone oxidoreductase E subunit
MALAFSPEAAREVEAVRSRYPDAQAACLPVLHIAQDEFGHLSDDAIRLVAATLGLPEAHVFGVVTFYTMFHRAPVGEHVLMVCTNVSCMLTGGYKVIDQIGQTLGIKPGETTADGKFTLVEEECLAACADAPMAICGRKYFLRLDSREKVDAMLTELRSGPSPSAGIQKAKSA